MQGLPQLRNSRPATVHAFPARFEQEDVNPHDEVDERLLNRGRPRILSIGDDSILLYSRRLILETAGYSVESARGELTNIERILLRRFDLVLICHTITAELLGQIVEASIRIAPQTCLLQISPLDSPFGNGSKSHPTLVSADPAALLSAVAGQLAIRGERCGNRPDALG